MYSFNVCMYTYKYVCICVYVCIYMQTYRQQLCVYGLMYSFNVCMYTYKYLCISVYTCIRTANSEDSHTLGVIPFLVEPAHRCWFGVLNYLVGHMGGGLW